MMLRRDHGSMNNDKLRVKGIFLDLDGTIVDSRDAYLEAAKAAFNDVGQNPPVSKLALEIPKRLEQGLPIGDIIKCDRKRFLKIYLDTYYSITGHKTKLFPNVSATLESLSKKAKLALITMRFVPKVDIIKELECFGIAEYFSHVVTALDTVKPKPSPQALNDCVRALDVEICDCIMAGDSVNDVRAGKAAGAKTVAVLSGLFACGELVNERPDLVLDDVNSLPNFVW